MSPIPPQPASTTPHWHWLPWGGHLGAGHAPAQGASAEQLARGWLGPRLGCHPDALPLFRDAHGRPRLGAPLGDRDISWSHSGEGLLVACAHGLVLGIDLERERPRPRAPELARRFFHADEAAWLEALPDPAARERAFLRLWCAKEALLKAHGRGLAFGLHKLAFTEGDDGLRLVQCHRALGAPTDWQLHEFTPRPGYRAALAWRPASAPHFMSVPE